MSETRAVANGPLRTAWALHLHLASWQAGILGLEDMVEEADSISMTDVDVFCYDYSRKEVLRPT